MRQFYRLTRQLYCSMQKFKPLQQQLQCSVFYQGSKRQTSYAQNIPELTLYSKSESCSLCDDAKEILVKHCHLFVFNEVDITAEGNDHWYHLYKHDIPVIHVNGTEIMRHRVFEKVLLDALELASDRK